MGRAFVLLLALVSDRAVAQDFQWGDLLPSLALTREACADEAKQLIGLRRQELIAKCGHWDRVNTTTTAKGTYEQVIYDVRGARRLYVYLMNGVVSTVQSDR